MKTADGIARSSVASSGKLAELARSKLSTAHYDPVSVSDPRRATARTPARFDRGVADSTKLYPGRAFIAGFGESR